MNNLNRVFLVVKEQCCRQKRLAEISNFGSIAHKTGIPEHRLPIYLDHLQDLGLIRYSLPEKYIYLTEKGKAEETVATEQRPVEARTTPVRQTMEIINQANTLSADRAS